MYLALPVSLVPGCFVFSSSAEPEPDPDEVIMSSCSAPRLEEGENTVRSSFASRKAVVEQSECGHVDIAEMHTWEFREEGAYRIRVESTGPVTLGIGTYAGNDCYNFSACAEGEPGPSRFGLNSDSSGGMAGELQIDPQDVLVATLTTEPLNASTGRDTYIAVGTPEYSNFEQKLPYVLTIERVAAE